VDLNVVQLPRGQKKHCLNDHPRIQISESQCPILLTLIFASHADENEAIQNAKLGSCTDDN